MEMPLYQSHKKVRALKIKEIRLNVIVAGNTEPVSFIIFEQEEYGTHTLSKEFLAKHKPEVGGYLVRYDDGYLSYSPAKAFEEGYTRVVDLNLADCVVEAAEPEAEAPPVHLFIVPVEGETKKSQGLLHSVMEAWTIKDVVTKTRGSASTSFGDKAQSNDFNIAARQSEKVAPVPVSSGSTVVPAKNLTMGTKDFTMDLMVATKYVIEFEDRCPLEVPAKFYHAHLPLIGDSIVKLATGQYNYRPNSSSEGFEVTDTNINFGNTFVTVKAPGNPVIYVPPKVMHALQIRIGDKVQIIQGEVTGVIRDGMVLQVAPHTA